ncbi:uncharacterized protein B0H18DRAFT_1005307 [Fomitopsis serialis]|uniref:uncharacterized protein n=1 Tax=Fomitopsis serialis TaxID=139415 RepID=UPI0020084F2D|nr:uncharacterized protein B0H18DRAFT_1005307 [Neoantrodia serialis]KAH9926730.1 hypothetical protein B0H18DRAFT_1005307 [Neoantrodia serialis]
MHPYNNGNIPPVDPNAYDDGNIPPVNPNPYGSGPGYVPRAQPIAPQYLTPQSTANGYSNAPHQPNVSATGDNGPFFQAYEFGPISYDAMIPQYVHGYDLHCNWDGGSCGVALDDLSPAGISRHLKSHHFGDDWQPRARGLCRWGTGCRRDEMNFESMGKHVAQVHLGTTRKQCSRCGGMFARNDALLRHQREHCELGL